MTLNRSAFADIQKRAGFTGKIKSTNNLDERLYSLSEVVDDCKDFITKSMPKNLRFLKGDDIKIKEETIKYIVRYVDKIKPSVRGVASLKELKELLIREITEFATITELLENPVVDEIQINGKREIFYESKGKVHPFDKGFENDEQLRRIIDKLIYDARGRLTPITPFINAKTYHGYRVNAIHPIISAKGEYGAVIRKFKTVRLSPKELIESQTFSRDEYELLRLIPLGGLSWITAGETGCGKTTLNELMAKLIKDRVITIENPPEYDLTRYGTDGKVISNVLSLVAISKSDAKESDPTMDNLIVNAMRQSPNWLAPGELRAALEFQVALIAAQTGHKFFTSMHADSGEDVIDRFLTAYCTVSNEPPELALKNICKCTKIIISMKKLPDGSRKIYGIYEVIGSSGIKPIIKTIYQYVLKDNIENDDGTITMVGEHKRVGKISEALQERLLLAGIPRKYFQKFTEEPDGRPETFDTTNLN